MKNASTAFTFLTSKFWKLYLPAFLVLNTIPFSLHAQVEKHFTNPVGPVIKYLGKVEDRYIFQVDVENKNIESYRISIEDEDGVVLYRQDFRDAAITKRFGFSQEEFSNRQLIFTVSKGREKQQQVFQVSINSRVVQDVVVAKH